MAILDWFPQTSAKKVEREQLQLVDVASKYENAPEIGDFVHITDCAYTEFQIGNGNQNPRHSVLFAKKLQQSHFRFLLDKLNHDHSK